MARPDFSEYVGHFTKNTPPLGIKDHGQDASVKAIRGDAYQRLVSILGAKKILATPMPWTNRHAVAFTECPWGSLLDHTKRYSAYGIGFKKSHLFAASGGPAIYLSPHLHELQSDFQSESKPDWKGLAGGPLLTGKCNASLFLNIHRNNWGCATSRAFREVAWRTADTVRLRFMRPKSRALFENVGCDTRPGCPPTK